MPAEGQAEGSSCHSGDPEAEHSAMRLMTQPARESRMMAALPVPAIVARRGASSAGTSTVTTVEAPWPVTSSPVTAETTMPETVDSALWVGSTVPCGGAVATTRTRSPFMRRPRHEVGGHRHPDERHALTGQDGVGDGAGCEERSRRDVEGGALPDQVVYL